MFIHNINPTLFNIGSFQIRYYGLVYVLGFLLLYFVFRKAAQRKVIKNLTVERAENFIILMVLALIVGARFFHVFIFEFSYYQNNILDALKIWQGGLSFHGGLVGLVLVAIWFCRRYKIKFYDIADTAVIPISIILCLGRIANFINGELYGTITNAKWCVDFSQNPYINGPEGCRHPSQLYEAGKNLFNFFLLFFLNGKSIINKKLYKPGFLFWLFITSYGILRFLITFYRDEPRILGASATQWFSLAMFVVGLAILLLRKKIKFL